MKSSRKSLVIIPSVRNPQVVASYARNAFKHKFKTSSLFFLILTEDFVDKKNYSGVIERAGIQGEVMNQRDRDQFLRDSGVGSYVDVFPRKSHAETSFGLLYLNLHASEFSNGFFVDDDTIPLENANYFRKHLMNLEFKGETLGVSSSTRWVNVLHHSFEQRKLYPRGFPYAAVGERPHYSRVSVSNVSISQGLWTNIPDLDSVRILVDGDLEGQSKTRLTENDYGEDFVVGNNNYLTICSMNLCFKSEVIPAFYQFKMDDNRWGIGRFDDIWSGVVAKKVLDMKGTSILNGHPLCCHDKAKRNTFKDLRSEAPGLEANEVFFRIVDAAKFDGPDIYENAQIVAETIARAEDPFIRFNGRHYLRWLSLLRKLR